MKTFLILPVNELVNPKTRLENVLSASERIDLVVYMTKDVLNASRGLVEIVVVSPTDFRPILRDYEFHMLKEDKKNGLNMALEKGNKFAIEMGADATIYVPADIPLIKREELKTVLREGEKNQMVIVPASKKGVGAVMRRPPGIMDIEFTSQSIVDIQVDCEKNGIKPRIVECPSMYFDLDNYEDVREFLRKERDILTYKFLTSLKKRPLI